MSRKADTRPFHLKQFSLFHHQSTMKVGTDSLLLGIWAKVNGVQRILDVGSGCGILSLLMAARSNAFIDAVELDKDSWAEAQSNFSSSKFSERLHAIHADFSEFSKETSTKYDLIISNPPFFINDMRSEKLKRSNARHGDSLSYKELCKGVSGLLQKSGRFCLVLPYDESKAFLNIADETGLHISRKLLIFPKRGLQPNRVNLELSFHKTAEKDNEIFVIREESNKFTDQYIHFFKDYLLGFD
jgi:tRNA1Val (adenine37-N6)-methyltransferase